MNRIIKEVSHFNPYAVWFALAVLLLTTFSIFFGGSTEFVSLAIFTFILFVIETLLINRHYKNYIELSNNTLNVSKQNIFMFSCLSGIILLSSVYSGSIGEGSGYSDSFNNAYILIILFSISITLNDLFITNKENNKMIFLLIDIMIIVVSFFLTSNIHYMNTSIIQISPIMMEFCIILFYLFNRSKIRLRLNGYEAVITVILFVGMYFIIFIISDSYTAVETLQGETLKILVIAAIKFCIVSVTTIVNIIILDLIWLNKLKEKCKSEDDFFLKISSLISIIIMVFYTAQIIIIHNYSENYYYNNDYVGLMYVIIVYLGLMGVRRRKGLDVWL